MGLNTHPTELIKLGVESTSHHYVGTKLNLNLAILFVKTYIVGVLIFSILGN